MEGNSCHLRPGSRRQGGNSCHSCPCSSPPVGSSCHLRLGNTRLDGSSYRPCPCSSPPVGNSCHPRPGSRRQGGNSYRLCPCSKHSFVQDKGICSWMARNSIHCRPGSSLSCPMDRHSSQAQGGSRTTVHSCSNWSWMVDKRSYSS